MADLKAKSRTYWRKRGFHVENGETIMHAPGGIVRRHDIFGFADLIAVPVKATKVEWPEHVVKQTSPTDLLVRPPWIWIQSTSWANVPARRTKIIRELVGQGQWAVPIRRLAAAVLLHHFVVIEGWRKKKGSRLYERREHWLEIPELWEGDDGT